MILVTLLCLVICYSIKNNGYLTKIYVEIIIGLIRLFFAVAHRFSPG